MDKAKINSEVHGVLKSEGVSVREYADVWSFLRKAEWGDGKVRFRSIFFWFSRLRWTKHRALRVVTTFR